MQAELQAAVHSLETSLTELGLELAPDKTEFLSIDGRTHTNPSQQLHLLMAGQVLTPRNGSLRLLGMPASSCNSTRTWDQAPQEHLEEYPTSHRPYVRQVR